MKETIHKFYCRKCKIGQPELHSIKYERINYFVQYYICRNCHNNDYRSQSKTTRKKIYASSYRSIRKYPQKHSCRVMLRYWIKKGIVIKPKICQSCGLEKPLDGHHEDYTKPKEVIWLCKLCHRQYDVRKRQQTNIA